MLKFSGNGYFNEGIQKEVRKDVIQKAIVKLTPRAEKFDAIAFTGMSGAVVAPILAYLLDKKIILVRKPKEQVGSHSSKRVEGEGSATRYIIVDDFSSTGATVRNIVSAIREQNMAKDPIPLFIYEYKHNNIKDPERSLVG